MSMMAPSGAGDGRGPPDGNKKNLLCHKNQKAKVTKKTSKKNGKKKVYTPKNPQMKWDDVADAIILSFGNPDDIRPSQYDAIRQALGGESEQSPLPW